MAKGLLLPVRPDGSIFSSEKSISSHLQLDGSDIAAVWKASSAKGRPGEIRILYGQGNAKDTTIALVCTGNVEKLSANELRERSRIIAATGVKALREAGCTEVEITTTANEDGKTGLDAHAAATAAKLALHKFDWKTSKLDKEKKSPVSVKQLGSTNVSSKAGSPELDWATGTVFADCQNLARELMDTPANLMTPTIFAERAQQEFKSIDNVTVNIYDEAWAKEKGMRTFLSVAAGTEEPAKFVEIVYKGAKGGSNAIDVAFVGKGITFDSGGISLKPGADMKLMRADMGGAATIVSSLLAISKLKMPINMVVCCAMTENMPSGHATKPGDIITAMNGKTIEVDNTDAEGRLVLADALYYATSVYKPKVCIDVATLTGAMIVAVADVYSGAFVTDDTLWKDLETAGEAEHDAFWRMPFNDVYLEYINKTGADLCNTGGRNGGSCIAAIFLKQFVAGLESQDDSDEDQTQIAYAHIDIAGVMSMSTGAQAYDLRGMSGKPVRALTEYVRRRAYNL